MATFHGENSLHVELFARDLHEARRDALDAENRLAEHLVEETQEMFHDWENIGEKERIRFRQMAKVVLGRYIVKERK